MKLLIGYSKPSLCISFVHIEIHNYCNITKNMLACIMLSRSLWLSSLGYTIVVWDLQLSLTNPRAYHLIKTKETAIMRLMFLILIKWYSLQQKLFISFNINMSRISSKNKKSNRTNPNCFRFYISYYIIISTI